MTVTQRRPAKHLTEDEVLMIHVAHADGRSYRDIAAEFGIDWTMVGFIVRGEQWRHLLPEAEALVAFIREQEAAGWPA